MKHWILSLCFLVALGLPSCHAFLDVDAHETVTPPNTAAYEGQEKTRLRVATFNIQHGRGHDGVVDLKRTASVATQHAIDIMLLNEVDRMWARSGREDQIERLGMLTGMEHTFFAPALYILPFAKTASPAYGNGVVSHVPWHKAEAVPLPQHDGKEPRNLVVIRIPLNPEGATLRLASTHLSTDRAERLTQIAFILQYLSLDDVPTLLLGDFNSQPVQPDMQMLFDAGWIDLWPIFGQGDGLTYPSDRPKHRIDYALASPKALPAVRRVEVIDTDASDHLPVIVELDLSALR